MDRWQEDVLTAGGPICLGLIEFHEINGYSKFQGKQIHLITQDAYDFFQLSTWLVCCFCLILVVFQVGRPLQEGEMFESSQPA